MEDMNAKIESILVSRSADWNIDDYEIVDRGDGPYIEYWNTEKLGAKPTEREILDTKPINKKTYTAEQLFDIFEPEYDAIYEASKTDKQVAFFFDKLRTRNRPIRADNPQLKQGLDLYVEKGLLERDKADQIISGTIP